MTASIILPRRALLLASLLSLAAAAAAAQADAPTTTQELKDLSLDQLMNVEVTSVARHPQTLLQSASAVQVITAEQIRRSGATSIPEALRLADNLEVAQVNSHEWAISARGFNTALANKLLVMIDGRTVYTPLYSGVFWDVQNYLLEDIDRIEVISGPGGTLWGANAVNGVINIITKKAADTQGVYTEAGAGNQLESLGGVRYGGLVGDDSQYRVYGKYVDEGDEALADGSPADDSWHQGQGGFRFDSAPSSQDSLSLHGDLYDGRENEETGNTERTGGGNVVGDWSHQFDGGSQMDLQSYYDRTHFADPIPEASIDGIPIAPPGFLKDDLTTYNLDMQQQLQWDVFNHVVWGLGYRFTHDVVQNAPGIGFVPATLDQNLYSAFLQDEIALQQDLSLIVGSKLEHNDYTGFEYEPNIRMLWRWVPSQTLWGAVSRAVRTPSEIDENLREAAPPYLTYLEGSSDFQSEELIAYELGYRAQLTSQASASVSTYYNSYDDVRSTSYTPETVLPLYFQNNLEGYTYGEEFSGGYQVFDNWSLHLGYDVLREHLHVKPGQYDLNDALNETADPQQQVALRSSATLSHHIELDAALRWVDRLPINNGATLGTVPSYFGLDGRVAWHNDKGLELSLVGQNLLQSLHTEYGFPGPDREQIARSVYVKATWRY